MELIINKLENEESVTRSEILALAGLPPQSLEPMLAAAQRVRDKYHGRSIHLRALIEFSNYCRCGCRYCGLSIYNKGLPRYRLPPEIIVATAREAFAAGYQTIVLQSGEDAWYSQAIMADIIKTIKQFGRIAVTLSLGERPAADYKAFKEAGADRYLIKQETANLKLYQRLHSGQKPTDRFRIYKLLHNLGYQVGGGFMVGLPPWNASELTDNLWLMKKFKLHMAGIGPFLPHPQTPLNNSAKGDFQETLKAVALARLLMPRALLPATTALETLNPGFRLMALNAGANVIMPKATPVKYRRLYNIYPKDEMSLNLSQQRERLENELKAGGYQVASGPGHAW